MVQAVGGSYSNYQWGSPVQGTASVRSTSGTNPYQPDGYYASSYSSPSSSGISSYAISAIVNDTAVAGRLSLFFINTSDRLLSVGAGWGGVGRFFINMLAGNVPLFTTSAKQQEISNNVQRWISSSDLVRTGASPFHALLLQDVGIWNVSDLANITNPSDQSILSQRLQSAAAARGSGDFPSQPMVASWVQTAIPLKKYNF